MNAFELTAVATFLSYFPDDIEYPTLIDRLTNDEFGADDDAIELWQPFEYYPGIFIVECIETLHNQLVRRFNVKCNAL